MFSKAVLCFVEHEPLVYYLTLLLEVEFYQLDWTVHCVRYLHLKRMECERGCDIRTGLSMNTREVL